MANVNFYGPLQQALMGASPKIARIKPTAISPQAGWVGAAAQIAEGALKGFQQRREDQDRSAIMAALTAQPELTAPLSPYLANQREAQQRLPDPKLGFDPSQLYSSEGLTEIDLNQENRFAPNLGLDASQLDPQERSAEFDSGLVAALPQVNDPEMMSALIGDVISEEQERENLRPAARQELLRNLELKTPAGRRIRDQTLIGQFAQAEADRRAAELRKEERDFQLTLKGIKPATADSTPASVAEFKFAKQNGFSGSFEDWQKISTTGSGLPANIREWEAFQQLSKPEQERYLDMKRAAPRPWDVGGELIVQATPATAERRIEKTPTPGETPELRESQAIAAAQGEEEVKGTIAEQKIDEAFAKEYAVGVAGGGYVDASKQVDQLESAIAELGTSEDLTGPARGMVPDVVRAFTNPKAVDIKERIEEVVQRNLRLILGPQFTENEGERLISRAYNDRLQEDVNVARLNRLVGAMRQALAAKMSAAQHYEDNGTLRGWKGVLPKKSDFTGLDFDSPLQANLPAGVRSVQVVGD